MNELKTVLSSVRYRLTTRMITEAGMMLALSTVLSLVKFYNLPYGGSVTAGSLIPIILLAMLRGPAVGITAGVVHGMIQYLLGGYFVAPAQFFLDYPIAFGALGVAGVFWLPGLRDIMGRLARHVLPFVAVFAAISLRFLAHFAAGIYFFSEYAPQGTPVWIYSLGYNASYLVPEFIISGVMAWLLAPSLTKYLRYRKN